MSRKVPAPYLFSDRTKAYAAAMRAAMLTTIGKVRDKDVAVLLSSGVDSNACLAAALVAGKSPTVYSATINGIHSKDFVSARATAKLFGLPFVGVNIDLTEAYVKRYLKYFIQRLRPDLHKNKTTIETSFIVFEILRRCKQRVVLSGFYGDAYFATLRSLKKLYDAGKYREVHANLRSCNAADPKRCQDIQQLMRLAFVEDKGLNIDFCLPYAEPIFIDAAAGMDPFVDGNRPIQKAPLRYAFYTHFADNADNVYIHSNLQKGELQVDEKFQQILLASDWNTRGLKSVIGIYNDLEVGHL